MSPFVLPRSRRGVLVSASALTLTLASTHALAVTFAEAVQQAAHAPTVIALDHRAAAAREDAVRAGRLPDPRLVVGIDSLPVTGPDAFDPDADDMTQKRVGIMQDLPSRARRSAERAQAARAVDLAQATRTERAMQAQEEAAGAWLDAWSARQALEALEQARGQARVATTLARARLAGGAGNAGDVMALQGAELDLDNRLLQARATLEAARAALARWLEVPRDADAVGAAPALNHLPMSAQQLRERVDALRPLSAWTAREALADSAIDAAVASRRPDWSVAAAYGQRSHGRSDMLMIEVSVGLPLRQRTRQDRDVAARRAEREAVAAERDDLRREIRADLEVRLAQYTAAAARLKTLVDQAVPLAHDRVDVAAAAYRSGAPIQGWLDARRDLLDRLVETAAVRADLGRAWTRLAFLLPSDGGAR